MPKAKQPDAELNPYASPVAAGGYFSEQVAGIGLWRDGKYLVMHQRADLPKICLKTGQPAERFVPFTLKWYYPLDWSTRRLRVQIPFCHPMYRQFRRRRSIGLLLVIFAIGFLIGSQLLLTINPPRGLFALITMCGCVAGTVLRSSPLRFVRARGDYLWFAGAGEPFLAQLPPWTLGH